MSFTKWVRAMYRKTLSTICLFSMLVCTCQAQQQVAFSEHTPIQTPMEARLTALENEVEQLRGSHGQQGSEFLDTNSVCGFNCQCCPQRRLEVGAEIVFLEPHSTTGLGPSGIAFFPSIDLQPSWRTWAGISNPNGIGFRGRYWEFDQFMPNTLNAFTYSLDVFVVDLETTFSKQIGDWSVLVSGGLRHVEFREDRFGLTNAFVNTNLTGIVVGGELSRPLTPWLSTFGVVRAANVYGEMSGEIPTGFIVVFDSVHSMMWETQLGVEITRKTRFGQIRLRSGVEAQHWDDITYKFAGGGARTHESIGLFGLFAGLTISR